MKHSYLKLVFIAICNLLFLFQNKTLAQTTPVINFTLPTNGQVYNLFGGGTPLNYYIFEIAKTSSPNPPTNPYNLHRVFLKNEYPD